MTLLAHCQLSLRHLDLIIHTLTVMTEEIPSHCIHEGDHHLMKSLLTGRCTLSARVFILRMMILSKAPITQ